MCSVSLNIIAGMTLALNANNPDMRIIYPFFIVGCMMAMFTYSRRQLIWPVILVTYYFFVNIFGFGRALGWW